LYDDGLRPCSRMLRLRLVEHQTSAPEPRRGSELRNCVSDKLRALCEACRNLRVEHADASEWTALLVSRPALFVDVYSEMDVYPEEMWSSMEVYLKNLAEGDEEHRTLPRGRYASAQALMARELPFLSGRSVGEVCHIVQVALSKRKLLGYIEGGIVPYACSTSMVKSRCAQHRCPVPGMQGGNPQQRQALAVADWEAARAKLREILVDAVSRGTQPVQLSNVKRLFRSLYQMELSETALGYTTLTEMLGDARFHDICTVRAQDRGHVVLLAEPCEAVSSEALPQYGMIECGSLKDSCRPDAAPEQDTSQVTPPPVAHTFIHFGPPFTGLSSPVTDVVSRRCRSLPPLACAPLSPTPALMKVAGDATTCSCPGRRGAAPLPSTAAMADPPAFPASIAKFCPDEPLCLEEAELAMSPAMSPLPICTPSPQYHNTNPEDSERSAWEATCRALGIKPLTDDLASLSTSADSTPEAKGEAGNGRIPFCPSEGLVIEEDMFGEPCFLRTPSPLYDSKAAWPWLQPPSSQSTMAAWAQVPGCSLVSHEQVRDDTGSLNQQDTLVLQLASMI